MARATPLDEGYRCNTCLGVPLRDGVRDRAAGGPEQVRDVVAEERDRGDRDDGDPAQDQRVLGHRLAVFAVTKVRDGVWRYTTSAIM